MRTCRSDCFALAASWLLFASAAPALAAADSVALHPLIIVGGESAEAELHSAFTTEAAKLSIELVDSELVRSFLKAQRNASCVGDDGCLAELAKKCAASRALLITVSPYSTKIVVSGRLVSARGGVLRSLSSREYAKAKGKSLTDSVQLAFREFLAELEVTAVELNPLGSSGGAVVVPPAGDETPTPPATPPAPGTPLLRMVSYGALGLGGAALLGSGAVALTAQGDRSELESRLDAGKNLASGTGADAELQRGLRMKSGLATGLLVGGGVALAAGAAVYFLAPEGTPVSVSAGADPSGASVSLAGRF
ncbi:MAG: hypothetical protein ACYC8T_09000 [Myxococcaceae bacterium]